MKVALFTGNYNHIPDGVSLTLNRLVKYLEDRGIEVLVFGPSIKNPPLKHVGELQEVPSLPMPGRPEYRLSLYIDAYSRNRLKQFAPDIIHVATPDFVGVHALFLAQKWKIPVVSTYHTHFQSYFSYYNMDYLLPIFMALLTQFYNHCDELYVPSESMKSIVDSYGFKTKTRIWERGIDAELFNPSHRNMAWRRNLGFSDEDCVILFVSRLVAEKGIETLTSVYKKLGSTYKWCIVGEGPVQDEMQRQMPEAVFTGKLYHEELSQAYASSDVFFFPSVTETFGNVTLEALASGLPCVVADAPGSKSLVQSGLNGYVISSNDITGYAKAISKLCDNRELRLAFSKEASLRANEFDWNKILAKMEGYYRSLLNSNSITMVS